MRKGERDWLVGSLRVRPTGLPQDFSDVNEGGDFEAHDVTPEAFGREFANRLWVDRVLSRLLQQRTKSQKQPTIKVPPEHMVP